MEGGILKYNVTVMRKQRGIINALQWQEVSPSFSWHRTSKQQFMKQSHQQYQKNNLVL